MLRRFQGADLWRLPLPAASHSGCPSVRHTAPRHPGDDQQVHDRPDPHPRQTVHRHTPNECIILIYIYSADFWAFISHGYIKLTYRYSAGFWVFISLVDPPWLSVAFSKIVNGYFQKFNFNIVCSGWELPGSICNLDSNNFLQAHFDFFKKPLFFLVLPLVSLV